MSHWFEHFPWPPHVVPGHDVRHRNADLCRGAGRDRPDRAEAEGPRRRQREVVGGVDNHGTAHRGLRGSGRAGRPPDDRRQLLPEGGGLLLLRERFIAPSERKWDTYRSCLRCFRKGIERRYSNIERVEVPYVNNEVPNEEGTTLPAWLLKADVKDLRLPWSCSTASTTPRS